MKLGFSMNVRADSQNVREYAPRGQQSNFDYAVPESRGRLTVWVGICENGELIGRVLIEVVLDHLIYRCKMKRYYPSFCKHLEIIFSTENFVLFPGRRMGHRHTDQWTSVIG